MMNVASSLSNMATIIDIGYYTDGDQMKKAYLTG